MLIGPAFLPRRSEVANTLIVPAGQAVELLSKVEPGVKAILC
jgi:hypothetical protein